jgi:hypothetical protein
MELLLLWNDLTITIFIDKMIFLVEYRREKRNDMLDSEHCPHFSDVGFPVQDQSNIRHNSHNFFIESNFSELYKVTYTGKLRQRRTWEFDLEWPKKFIKFLVQDTESRICPAIQSGIL